MDKAEKLYFQSLLSLMLVLGLVWLMSGMPKLLTGTFPGILQGILVKFASANPYPFYKSFLEGTAIPNAVAFGHLVVWGELLSGIAITLSSIYLIIKTKRNQLMEFLLTSGLLGGLFLNINFFLGGGWINQTKAVMNILMIMLGIASLIAVYRIFKKNK